MEAVLTVRPKNWWNETLFLLDSVLWRIGHWVMDVLARTAVRLLEPLDCAAVTTDSWS